MSTETLHAVSKTTVLIIGAGPTGLTSGLLLAKHGLRCIIIERHLARTGQPKAHAINPRSLEIFRQIGLDTAQLRKESVPPEDGDTVRFVVSMAGLEHGSLPYERQDEGTKDITPEPLFNIPQPDLEDFLLAAVAKNNMIALHRGVQWETASRDGSNALSSKVTERQSGCSKVIESTYILDCGGANSRARQQLGIPFNTLPEFAQNEVHHLSIHIKADLTQFAPGTLWWVANPSAEGTFICYRRASSWVFVTYYDPKTTPQSTFSEAYCRTLVDNAIGKPVPYELLSITVWSTLPRTADFFQSRTFPQAFVVGDAAHAFPPTGGLGVNTGIADAQNLAWKIAAIEQSWAPESILATYGPERRPVAVANARQSVRNQVKLRGLKAALRDRPAAAGTAESAELEQWKNRLDHELRENSEHFDSINLQIGYTYGRKDDGPCDVYVPRGVPGARLPHTWITHASKQLSILDLIKGDSFVLFTREDPSQPPLPTTNSAKGSVPLQTVKIGVDCQITDDAWLNIVGMSRLGSGLLVRPDQHILGSAKSMEDVERLLTIYLQP